jgi:hypothetical protein
MSSLEGSVFQESSKNGRKGAAQVYLKPNAQLPLGKRVRAKIYRNLSTKHRLLIHNYCWDLL